MKNLIKTELPFLTEEISTPEIKSRAISSSDQFNEISSDILLLTSEIEIKYPDLYKHLDETPVLFSKVYEKVVTVSELENYLETLELQLVNHFNSHELNLMQMDFIF